MVSIFTVCTSVTQVCLCCRVESDDKDAIEQRNLSVKLKKYIFHGFQLCSRDYSL